MQHVRRAGWLHPLGRRSRTGERRPASSSAWWPVLRTIALYLFTWLVVVTVIFALPRMMPGDPIRARMDPSNALFVNDPAGLQRLESYYGLDKPLPQQYATYLLRITHGDLGWSIDQNVPVSSIILGRLPWTLLLTGTSLLASSLIAYVAGVSAAWWRGRKKDRILVTVMTALRSVPDYAIASILLVVFAVALPVLPLAGASTVAAQYASWWDAIADIGRHLALPATALTIALVGARFLLVRNTTVSVLGQDYMLLARAKGLPTRLLKYRHAGRNALLPFITLLGIEIGFAVGGAIFVETVFAYPGMGSLILSSVAKRDYPVLEGAFLTLASAVLLANLVIDLLYRRIDPRAGART